MNASSFFNSKAGMVTLGVVTVGVLLYFFGGQAKQAVKDAAAAVSNVNAGTPYEGAGVVGTLGNAANQISGGALQDFGEWIGGSLYEWTHPSAAVMQATSQKPVTSIDATY